MKYGIKGEGGRKRADAIICHKQHIIILHIRNSFSHSSTMPPHRLIAPVPFLCSKNMVVELVTV